MRDPIAAQFLLRPDMTFLNHGSFGATPRPVFATYQQWQRELESQPVEFLGRRIADLLAEARRPLAALVGCDADDLVYVPNVTVAINIIARSLQLQPGDQVLANSHEYGAVARTWRFVCAHAGAEYVEVDLPLPLTDHTAVADTIWAAVTPRTRVLVVSELTSPTALRLPVADLVRRARAAGIISVIDGAHVPGQYDIDLRALDADFYAGNCHKWLLAPKGAGFLYARRDRQPQLEPLIVSWGWQAAVPGISPFQDYFGWTGTADPAAYLSVPAAIAFQQQHDWPAHRRRSRALLAAARQELIDLLEQPAICPADDSWWRQLAAVQLPPGSDPFQLKTVLWDEHRIEIPTIPWPGAPLLRISVQAYNAAADLDHLITVLKLLKDQGKLGH
jgi:isopenicillin-N epimerase